MAGLAVVALAFVAVVVFTVLAYRRSWRWTGLPADPGDGTPLRPARAAKNLWDWLQLLIVPLVLALAAFALNTAQAERDRRQEERRDERAQVAAADRAREETLRTYIQQMSDLITGAGVKGRTTGMVGDTRTLARTLTLVALRRLDGKRKGLVVQFLMEAGLITHTVRVNVSRSGRTFIGTRSMPKITLALADLRDATMPSELGPNHFRYIIPAGRRYGYGRLRAASFAGADVRGADFRGSSLIGVSFERADLRNATLDGAQLGATSFYQACLSGASFVGARALRSHYQDFSGAGGRGIDFSRASLDRSVFTGSSLADVKLERASLRGIRVPRGWTTDGSHAHDAEAENPCRFPE